MSATDPRIAVVGAGAVGGWIAARLAASGSAVNLLARGATLQAIRRDGLRLTEAGNTTALRVNVSDAAADFGPQDVLILAVKAPALAQAADAARPLLGDQTLILPMLNGVPWWFVEHARLRSVDPDGSVAAAFPLAQVMGVGSSRVDLQACKLEYSIVSPK